MNKTDVYIPALLKFVDDKISISESVQKDIHKSVTNTFRVKNKKSKKSGFNILLNESSLLQKIRKEDCYIDELRIEVYYYHHRIIFHYTIEHRFSLSKKLSSSIRNELTIHFKENIEAIIIEINKGVINSDNFKSDKDKNSCKIIMYYSYPIIFQYYEENAMDWLKYKLETMYFRVFLPNKEPFSFGSPAYIRISIPSFYVFYEKELDDEIISSVINAIYQTVLYKKKTDDSINKTNIKEIDAQQLEAKPFSNKLLDKYNLIDEAILKDLWKYSMDSMGGKISDNQQAKVSKTMFVVSMTSLFIAFLSIGLAIFLS